VAALPTFAVFSSVITLPAMSEKELGQAIRWEARKFVPLPLEEMILIGSCCKVRLLVRVVRTFECCDRRAAESGEEVPRGVQGAGLELLSLGTEAFALGEV
jgi:type IV pilus assembly protein PilM